MDLGDGFLPVDARLDLPTCLGTDSQARVDLLGEARTLEWHARALLGRRNVLTPPDGGRHSLAAALLGSATLAGARSLGAQSGLEEGAPADFVAIDLDRPAADGVPPLEAAVFSADPAWITDVWIGGDRVVADSRHFKRAEIREEAVRYLP